jgi:galactose mutarotase-like enzyme
MFNVQRISGDLEVLELTDSETDSRVLIAPERGGMVTRFRCGNREVLYLDEETLADPAQNVRGGIPILFPSPGPLVGGRYSVEGKEGQLPQHGFARNQPFTITDTAASTGASATLTLVSSDATRAHWPWDFELACRYTLAANKLRLDVRVTNTGSTPMPFAFGVHPYLKVPETEKSGARVETQASRAWDNVQKKEIRLDRVALGGREVDLHLLDHNSSRSALSWNDDRITVESSPDLRRWVIWTLPSKPFVCLEPWTGLADALNTGDGRIVVPPGESHSMFIVFTGDMKQDKPPRPVREYNGQA